MAELFEGMPITVSEAPEPGQAIVMRSRRNGTSERAVFMHPTLAYAFSRVVEDPTRRTSDISVMIEASLQWQNEVIERNARWAIGHLANLEHRQEIHRIRRELDAEVQERLTSAHPMVKHQWTRDRLRATAWCELCNTHITEETAHRLGIDLPGEYRGEELGRWKS